ncbi:MAG: hypothetical protein ACRD2Q_05610 [Terriglobales bacterium]
MLTIIVKSMSRREKGLLVAGIIIGLAIFGVMHAALRVGQPPDRHEAAVNPGATPSPPIEPTASSAIVGLRLDAEPAKVGAHATFRAQVRESGTPVTDAHVWLTLSLAERDTNGREEIRVLTDLYWNGSEYVGKAYIPRAGHWTATAGVGAEGHPATSFRIEFEAR